MPKPRLDFRIPSGSFLDAGGLINDSQVRQRRLTCTRGHLPWPLFDIFECPYAMPKTCCNYLSPRASTPLKTHALQHMPAHSAPCLLCRPGRRRGRSCWDMSHALRTLSSASLHCRQDRLGVTDRVVLLLRRTISAAVPSASPLLPAMSRSSWQPPLCLTLRWLSARGRLRPPAGAGQVALHPSRQPCHISRPQLPLWQRPFRRRQRDSLRTRHLQTRGCKWSL